MTARDYLVTFGADALSLLAFFLQTRRLHPDADDAVSRIVTKVRHAYDIETANPDIEQELLRVGRAEVRNEAVVAATDVAAVVALAGALPPFARGQDTLVALLFFGFLVLMLVTRLQARLAQTTVEQLDKVTARYKLFYFLYVGFGVVLKVVTLAAPTST